MLYSSAEFYTGLLPMPRNRIDLAGKLRSAAMVGLFLIASPQAWAQGGPPYYTNDPGTPGDKNWEINLGYMPFLFNGASLTHTPDVDINYGVGDRIQLTYESAWLRVTDGPEPPKYGLNQDQLGVKWRFYDNDDNGLGISLFPQFSVNNPDHAAQRGITPGYNSLELPLEFTKKLGPVDINWELGYNKAFKGPDGWLAGFVIGKDITKKLELDAEFYGQATWDHSINQETVDVGARYKLRPPFILLLMAGRSVAEASKGQPYFVGYFGMQFLLPPKPFDDK